MQSDKTLETLVNASSEMLELDTDHSKQKNRMGFSMEDSNEIHADFDVKTDFTDNILIKHSHRLWKYKRQLTEAGFDIDDLKNAIDEVRKLKKKRKQNEESEDDFEKLEEDADLDVKDIDPELIIIAERLADRIRTHGDPVKYIMRTVAKKHERDEKTIDAIAVSIGCQCSKNSSGMHVSVNGESGSGKSHALKTYTKN